MMQNKFRRLMEKVYHNIVIMVFIILGKLPKKNLFFFESFHGKQYSDNPRAIYEYLRDKYPDVQCVWTVKKGFEQPFIEQQIPYVRRMGIQWLLTMPRAKYWIFNTRMPLWMVKTKGTTFVQTWHGTPLKHLGLDIENVNMPSTDTKRYRENFVKESKRWDYLISPNSYSSKIFRQAFSYSGKILEIGYPRNDILLKSSENRKGTILDKLGISKNKKIILYAPTWRDNQFYKKGSYKFNNNFPFAEILKENPEVIILLRTHYLVVDSIETSQFKGKVIDVSKYPDISDLYLISDLLITDYSSVMFDFAYTKRPMLFYMYDQEEYDEEIRGFYFHPQKELPGPIIQDGASLLKEIKKISKINNWKIPTIYEKKYETFLETFCPYIIGNSAEKLISIISQ